MTRATSVRPEFVEYIPEGLDSGVLYISRRYSTASHLCCCGCGREVVTPLNPAKWRLIERDGIVSLSPSIGNWGFPCKSHYWIRGNAVQWAGAMSDRAIAAVKERDRADAASLANHAPRPIVPARERFSPFWARITGALTRWWWR